MATGAGVSSPMMIGSGVSSSMVISSGVSSMVTGGGEAVALTPAVFVLLRFLETAVLSYRL